MLLLECCDEGVDVGLPQAACPPPEPCCATYDNSEARYSVYLLY